MNRRASVVAVSGIKNSGKTGLIVRLIPELAKRGLRIATVKHDGHSFEADRPGTDSFRHLEAGAVGTAVFDGEKFQLVRHAVVDEDFLIAQFPDADLILLEGFKDSLFPKLEIVRAAVSQQPVSSTSTRLALVTDLEFASPGCPVFAPDDIEGIADFLFRFTQLGRRFSAILLAGGYSSRMGKNKAELPFGGMRMLDYQVHRLRLLGIEEILIAGYSGSLAYSDRSGCGNDPAVRIVPDLFPHRGPLSGIHAGLTAAGHASCLVLSVDAPLVPYSVLLELIEQHIAGVTVLGHDGQVEPLIGVYDRALAPLCGEILAGENSSVRQLFARADFRVFPSKAEPLLLSNCNTPEEYARLVRRFSGP